MDHDPHLTHLVVFLTDGHWDYYIVEILDFA